MNFICDSFLFCIRFVYTGIVLAMCFLIYAELKASSKTGTIFTLHDRKNNENIECFFRKDFLIGRHRYADIFIPNQNISRRFATLSRQKDSSFLLKKIGSGFISINGKELLSDCSIKIFSGDVLKIEDQSYDVDIEKRKLPAKFFIRREVILLSLLTAFLLLMALNIFISFDYEIIHILFCFCPLLLISWGYWGVVRYLHLKDTIAAEICAILLSSISLAVAAPEPQTMLEVTIYICIGFCAFIFLSFFSIYYQNQTVSGILRIKKILLIFLFLLIGANLIFSQDIHGSRNWIRIAGISIQPGEIAKFLLILILATPLELMGASSAMQKQNRILMLIATVMLSLAYILISDLGGLAILVITIFCAYFLQSGAILNFSCFAVIFGVFAKILSNVSSNFHSRMEILGKAFSDPSNYGYQQVKALGAIILGGLFGVGIGNGTLRQIFASNTDLVLFVISEEFGLIFLFGCIAINILFVISAVINGTRKSYFGNMLGLLAVTTIIFQVLFSFAGGANLMPWSGVTSPFLSIGGTSLLVSWSMLALIATDLKKG